MKYFFPPIPTGVIKDYNSHVIPDDKASDIDNVMIDFASLKRRWGTGLIKDITDFLNSGENIINLFAIDGYLFVFTTKAIYQYLSSEDNLSSGLRLLNEQDSYGDEISQQATCDGIFIYPYATENFFTGEYNIYSDDASGLGGFGSGLKYKATFYDLSFSSPGTINPTDMVYYNNKFILARNNAVYYSTDGVNWVLASNYALAYFAEFNNKLYGVSGIGSGEWVCYSSDGITWTNEHADTSDWDMHSVTSGEINGTEYLCYVGEDNNINAYITSTSSGSDVGISEMNTWSGVAYGTYDSNGYFVAVAQDGTHRIAYNNTGLPVALDDWKLVTAPEANTWQDIAFGNDIFVAVSSDGTHRVMTSSNVTSWTVRTASTTQAWKRIYFVNDIFLVANDDNDVVMTSSDGITWTTKKMGPGFIAYGLVDFSYPALDGVDYPDDTTNCYLSMANGKKCISEDLVTSYSSGETYTYGILDLELPSLTYTFLAGSTTVQVSDTSSLKANYRIEYPDYITAGSKIASVVDGTSITLDHAALKSGVGIVSEDNYPVKVGMEFDTTIIMDSSSSLHCICVGRSLYLGGVNPAGERYLFNSEPNGIGGYGANRKYKAYLYQGDGFDPSAEASEFLTSGYGNGLLIAYDDFNGIGVGSFDGVGWFSLGNYLGFYDFIYISGIFYAVGGSYVSTSANGVNWTNIDIGASNLLAITYGDGVFVTAGENGEIFSSTDGTTWISRTSPDSSTDWKGLAYGNSTFVGVGYGGTVHAMTSPDGITWTARTAAGIDDYRKVIYAEGLFVAPMYNSSYGDVMTSPDGITWTYRGSVSAYWEDIAYGGGVFVVVGYVGASAECIRSVDGITWTESTTPEANHWRTVAYGNNMFAAFSYDGTHRIMTSPDGTTWTAQGQSDVNVGLLDLEEGTLTYGFTNGSTNVTVSDTTNLKAGYTIENSTYLNSGTTISAIVDSTNITISANAKATGSSSNVDIGMNFNSEVFSAKIYTAEQWSISKGELSTGGALVLCTDNLDSPLKIKYPLNFAESLGGSPSVSEIIAFFGSIGYEHTILGETASYSNGIEVSDAGDPETWSGAYYQFLNTSEKLKGIVDFKSRIFLFKKHSITLMAPSSGGGNDDPFDYEEDKWGVGTPSIRTVVNIENGLFFLSNDGIFFLNGISLKSVGDGIFKYLTGIIDWDNVENSFAFHVRERGLYCLFIPTYTDSVSSVNADTAFVFNYRTQSWMIWSFDSPTIDHCSLYQTSDTEYVEVTGSGLEYTNKELHILAFRDGTLRLFDEVFEDDNDTDISCSITTKDFPVNDIKHVIKLEEIVLGMVSQTAGTIQIRASVDSGNTWSDWISVDITDTNDYIERVANFIRRGNYVRFEIQNVSGSSFEIQTLSIGYNEEGGVKK